MLDFSEHALYRLTDTPRIGTVVSEAMTDARRGPETWVICRQLLTLREWYCLFVGRPFMPGEPQLAVMWLPATQRWRIAMAAGVPELEGIRFRRRGFRVRFPRLMVERYDP